MSLTKFESHHLDPHIWSYKIYKTTFKTVNLNYPLEQAVTDGWDPVVSWTRMSVRQNRGGGFDGAATVELADGDSSGDTEDTYAIYVMR